MEWKGPSLWRQGRFGSTAGWSAPQQLFAKDGLLEELKKALSERMLPAELDVPRDRAGTFDPGLIAKYQRRFADFDDKIISIVRARHDGARDPWQLVKLYEIYVSPDLIPTVTDAVLEAVGKWQGRPLDACYPHVFFDPIRVKLRGGGFVRNKAVYIALDIQPACPPRRRGHEGGARHLDRTDRGRQGSPERSRRVPAARHERAREPRRRRHPDRPRIEPAGSSTA